MRKVICFWCLGIFLLVGCSYSNKGKGADMQISPTMEIAGPIKMDRKATASISGKDFKPGQEINILLTANDGMQSDIGYALEPTPKADESGVWSTTWKCGDFVRRKMVKADISYKITATDGEYNAITHTSVTFKK